MRLFCLMVALYLYIVLYVVTRMVLSGRGIHILVSSLWQPTKPSTQASSSLADRSIEGDAQFVQSAIYVAAAVSLQLGVRACDWVPANREYMAAYYYSLARSGMHAWSRPLHGHGFLRLLMHAV